MRNIKIAALQFSCCSQVQENIDKAETMVREAASTVPISSFFLNYLKDRIFVRKSDTIIMIMPCL